MQSADQPLVPTTREESATSHLLAWFEPLTLFLKSATFLFVIMVSSKLGSGKPNRTAIEKNWKRKTRKKKHQTTRYSHSHVVAFSRLAVDSPFILPSQQRLTRCPQKESQSLVASKRHCLGFSPKTLPNRGSLFQPSISLHFFRYDLPLISLDRETARKAPSVSSVSSDVEDVAPYTTPPTTDPPEAEDDEPFNPHLVCR